MGDYYLIDKYITKRNVLRGHSFLTKVAVIILLVFSVGAKSQTSTWTMVNGETISINGCEYGGGIIYDNGGAEGEYTNNFEGWVVITAQPGMSITLSGNYVTESSSYDWINVWDGDATTGTQLVTQAGGTGSINVTATSGMLTFYFRTDGSSVRSGFALEWSRPGDVGSCSADISSLTASNITTNTATLSWTTDAPSLNLDYGDGIQTVTGNSINLTGLNSNTVYTVRLYADGDATNPCCVARTSFRTLCSSTMEIPIVESFDDYGYGETVFPTCWTLITNIDGTIPTYVCNDNYISNPASLRMSTTSSGYYSLAIMPEVMGTAMTQLMMRMRLRSPSAGTKVEVGVCNDTGLYNNNFTTIQTLNIDEANTWQEVVVSFSNYAGSGLRPALRIHGDLQSSANRVVFIDEMRVETCGVWHQALLKRNAHDMWVQWDEYGDPQVDVEYGPAGFEDGSGITLVDTTSPLHVSGLDPATSYEFRFHSGCGGGAVSSSYRSTTLSTLEGPRNDLNLCEGFESGGNVPSGWRRHNTYESTPQTSNSYRHSGGLAMRFRPNYQTKQPTVVLPMVDTVPVNQLSVGFWALSDGYTSGSVVVGVMEYPEVASSFVPVDTVYVNADRVWQHKKVSLEGYTGAGEYLALRVYDPSTSYNSIYIDDLEVGTCLLNGVYVTNFASHSVELRWDSVDDSYHGDSVIVEYGGSGFLAGEGTRVAVAVRGDEVTTVGGKQTVTLIGLEADSSYEFYVYGQCGVQIQACAVTTLSAHTLEQDLSLPYCVDFEGLSATLPAGWTRTSTHDGRPTVNATRPHNGSRSLNVHAYGGLSLNHSTAILPMLDVDSVQGLTVSFWGYGTYSGNSYVQVGVMDDPTDENTFVSVASNRLPYNIWRHYVHSLATYQGSGKYIALRYYHDCNYCHYEAWLDEVVVSDAAVWNPQVSSVTSHGATFTWNGTGRAYNGAYVEWDTAGFVRGTGHKDTVDANTLSLTVDTLQMGTAYDYFITALSSETSNTCNYSRSRFTTFEQPTASSYCYGFEDVADNGYPIGWSRPSGYNGTPHVYQYDYHSGNKCMYLRCDRSCSQLSTPAIIVMPYLEEVDLSGLTLRFYAKGNNATCTRLAIGFMSNPNDISTFEGIDTLQLNSYYNYDEYIVNLAKYTGPNRHLAFNWYVLDGCCTCCAYDLYIDDITIDRCRVSRVRAYSETMSSVKIDWDSTGLFDSVQIEYGLQGFAPGSGTFVTTVDTAITLSGLPQAGANYDFYVRPYCTGSSQVCSETKYQFATTPWRVGDEWCYDFESHDGNGSMPWWWRRAASYDSWPKIWTHGSNNLYYTSYQSAFEFRAVNSTLNIAVMPYSEDPLNELVLSFNIRCTENVHPERASLIVGVMPNPYDTADFVAIDTLHPTFLYQRRDVSFASYSGPYRHIAFKYKDNDNRITYIDDLTLSRCRAANVKVTSVADSSISLSWQRMGYTDTTYILYGLIGEAFEEGTLLRVVGSDTTFGGLLPDTTYWFYLYGGCADTLIQCQGARVHQRTLAEPMRVPVCFLFDGLTGGDGLPIGWTRPYGNTESGQYDGTLRLFSFACNDYYNDRTNMLVMPQLEATSLDGIWLDFNAQFDYSPLQLEVGVMTDPYDSATFVPIDTLNGNNDWRRYAVDLSQYTGTGRFIAFRSYTHYCNSGFIHLDRVSLRSCVLTSATVGQPTDTSLTLSYTATTGTTGAWVEYKHVGGPSVDFTPGSGDTLHLNPGTPLTLNGLEYASWYAFHFYPDCGEGSDACNYILVRAQTLHPGVDIPYCESFDDYASGNYPNNWRRHTSHSNERPYLYSGVNRSPDNALFFETDGDNYAMAVMPRLNVGHTCPLVDSLYANFWMYSDYYWDHAVLVVGIITDANDPSTFQAIDTLRPAAYATWEHHTVAIRNFSSTNTYVAYKFLSSDGYYTTLRIDDLCMEKCVAADVTVGEITQNSVTISWTSFGVDSLMCEYGPRGFAAGSGTLVVLHNSPAILSGLDDGTDYQFSFASVCGCQQYGATYAPGGGSGGGGGAGGCGRRYCGWCWGWTWHYAQSPSDSTYRYWCWGPWHGHPWSWTPTGGTYYPPYVDTVTTQASFLQVPYCEGFEEYERIQSEDHDLIEWPRSWRRIHGQNPGYPKLTKTNHHTGENSLVFYSITSSHNYAALAPLEPGQVDNLVLTFFAYSTNQNAIDYPRFVVGVMSDPDNASTFVPVDTVRLNTIGQWEQHVVDLATYAGSGQYVAFYFKPYNGQYHFYVDDIYLGNCAISDVSTSTTVSAVTLNWQTHHSPTQLQILYGQQGFLPENGEALDTLFVTAPSTGTCNLTTVAGIQPTDNYDLYVTALCGADAAGCFSSPITLNPCLKVPYCEDFEDLPTPEWPYTVIPSHWKVVQRNSGRPQYPRSEIQYSQNIIAFYPNTGDNSNTVLLPPLPDGDSLNGKWVYAYFATSNNNYIFLDFGYLTDTNNASTFVQMASLSNGASEKLKEFNVQLNHQTVPQAGTAYNRFALRARSTSGERWIRLSKLIFSNYPYPTGINHVAMGVARQRITWSGQYQNAYYGIELVWKEESGAWRTENLGLSDSCSAILTGLQPGKHYDVYFISPDGERLCQPYSFTTDTYEPIPYCNDFENTTRYSMSDGWTRSASWTTDYSYPRVERDVHYYSPHQSLQFHTGCGSNRWCSATMPDIDIDSLRHANLHFRMTVDYTANNMMIIGIQTEKDNPSTFVPIDTISASRSIYWQPYNISLTSYQGDGRYLTFRYVTTNGNCHYAYIDDLTISPCILPDFTIAGAHQVKAQLPAESNSVADYWVEYGEGTFVQGQQDTVWNADSTSYTMDSHGTVVHVTENPFYLTGLKPNTQYSIYTRCGEQDSTCAAPTVLTTAQELPLPYCNNFDSYDNEFVPTGWYSYSSYGDNYPRTYYSAYQSCCMTMDFYCDNNHLQYTTLPDIDIDSIRNVELYFSLRIENINYTKLIVGVMEDRADFNTFVPVDTLTCSSNSTYYSKHVSLSNYYGTGHFVAFRILTSDGYRRPLYVDDLRVNSYPTPQITLYDANTVRILRRNGRDFWIEMAPQDTVQGADTNRWFHITQDTFDITGLDYLTTYDFYHHADSGTVTCFPRTQITTSIVLPMPYCDNFNSYDNYIMVPNWNKYNKNNNDYPRIYNGAIEFYNNCNSGSRSYAIMPELDIDSLRHAHLYAQVKTNNSNNYLLVGVMSNRNDINTFVTLDTLRPTTTDTWYEAMHVSFSQYTGTGRFVAFCMVNPTGNCGHMYIGNLYIQSCPRPSIQLVGGTTVASIIDTQYTADYWLEYGPQGMTPGSIDTVYNADSTAYTLQAHNTLLHITEDTMLVTGLADNTTYDFYARCDSVHTSCYPLTARITTSRLQSVPYCEEFASYGSGGNAFPTGWRRYMSDNNKDRLYIYNDSDAGDGKSLRFYIYNNLYAYAVLPETDVEDIKNLYVRTIQWSQGSTDPYEKFLEVGVMTDMNDITTFQTVDTLQNTASGCWQELMASLANYNGTGRFIALRMRNTTSNWRNIYIDRLQVLTCDIPTNISATLHSHNQVRIDADEQSSTGFWVEYDTTGFVPGSGHYTYVDQLPFDITLDNLTTYDFYFRCDTLTPTCLAAQTVTTLAAPLTIPYCENFDNVANEALPTGWTKMRLPQEYGNDGYVSYDQFHTSSKSLRLCSYYPERHPYVILPDLEVDSLRNISVSFWMMNNNHNTFAIDLGVMSDPNDASTFLTVKQFKNTQDNTWQRMQTSLSNIPGDARFIAFRLTKTDNSWDWVYIDDLYLAPCGASEMHLTNVEANQVTFDWLQTGNPQITIEYGPTANDRSTYTSFTAVGQQHPTTGHYTYTLTGLDNLTNYKFYFDAICDDGNSWCSTNYSDSATVFTPSGGTGCIDPTNLTADYTTCFYGSYGNPLASTGVMDYGSGNINSRHTVHFDTTERDPRTGNLLRTVPEGAQASVRLGNWNDGSQAEAISYSLTVDTTQFDLLILKYAAVLQDKDHPASSQPRFRLELLDTTGALLDTCSRANFIASQSLGWNTAADYVLWKDWTTVGVDMTPYHGQTVHVRLTVYDCADGNHYGYAYFTLNCQMKNLISDHCGVVAENRFTAPDGFNYNWYTNLSDTTFSTARDITVETNDSITYFCRLSFVDNPACHFTMSAFAGTRWPLSLFDSTVVVRDCHFEVTFANHSTISTDGVNPVGTGESVETATWDFGNGTTSTTFNPTVTYDSAGTYTVQLVSTIAGGACVHTLEKDLVLAFPPTNPHITGVTDRCAGEAADTLWLHETVSATGGWTMLPDTTNEWIKLVAPLFDTTYSIIATDSNGCTHSLEHTVAVHPVYHNSLSGVICNGTPFAFSDTNYTTEGTYLDSSLTVLYLCDSITTLQLTVNQHSDSTVLDTVNELQLPWSYLDTSFVEGAEGLTFVIPNAAGCDSTITYSLTVLYNAKRTLLYDTVCESTLPYLWQGHQLDSSCVDSVLLAAAHGEDSTVVLNLHVFATTYSNINDSVVENQLPYLWNGVTFDTVTQVVIPSNRQAFTLADTTTLTNAEGCDSIAVMTLTVFLNVDTVLFDTVCESVLPLAWNHRTFSAGGTQFDTLHNIYGADSLITMNLHVIPSTYATVHDTVLENDLPHAFADTLFTADTTDMVIYLTNAAGCDSVLTYSLTVHWNSSTPVDSTVCADQLPLAWNNRTFTAAGTLLDTLLTNEGADSIIRMTLRVNPVYNDTIYDTICDNQNRPFEDSTYTLAGSYPHLLMSAAGCDSLRVLHLVVNATTVGDTVVDSCDHFTWYGITHTASCDTVTHLTTNLAGCDSTVTLQLTIRHSTDTVVYDTIVENQLPYLFNGVSFNNDTLDASVTISNAAGCDSIIAYSLMVYRNGVSYVDSTVCASELPLAWNHCTFTAAGIQNDTLSDAFGADSIVHMTLHVNPIYHDTVNVTICNNQSYLFEEDSTYTLAGNYTHHLQTEAGCDSLRTLILVVNDTTLGDTVVDVCDRFSWYDSTYTTSTAAPTHMSTNAMGCDSTTTLHLTVRHSTASAYFDTVVENQLPHLFHDSTFADSVSHYPVVIPNSVQCDSVIDYSLFVHRNVDTTLYDTVCNSELPLSWNGTTFDTTLTASATMQRDVTYQNIYGADSTVVMMLTVHPLYDHHIYDTICDNQSFAFGTHTFEGADGDTVHLDSLLSAYGCDSLSTLHLKVHPTFDHHLYDTICTNIAYLWGTPQRIILPRMSLETDGSGSYPLDTLVTDTLTSHHACDSLSTVHLHLLAAYDLHYYDTVCQGESSSFEGNDYDTSGIFNFQLTTVEYSCDSLRSLHLTVNPVYDIHIYDTIFDGDRYPFEGIYYDTTGIYDTLLTTQAGCDSLRTLHLQRNPRTPHDSTVCQNTLPVVWNGIVFNGAGSFASDGTPRGVGIRTDRATVVTDSVRLEGRGGIDSLVVMVVTILDTSSTIDLLTVCDSLVWQDDNTYFSSTTSPYLVLSSASGCDSVVHLNLTVNNTHYSTDRILACDSLQWIDQQWYYRDTSATVGTLGSNTAVGPVDTLTTVEGCDSVVALNLTLHFSTYEETLDTFCFNQAYIWRNQIVDSATGATHYTTVDFYLTDTLSTVWNCDSVLAINLTRMGRPLLKLDFEIDCIRQYYDLGAEVTLDWGHSEEQPPYISWSSYPLDSHLADSNEGAEVTARPSATPTTYSVYVDYHETPLCPVSQSLRLLPIVIPQAEINTIPEAMSYDKLGFDAYDVTHAAPRSVSPDSVQVWQRRWYVDEMMQNNTTPHLSWEVPMADVDSVVIWLSIYNGQCYDTAVRVVPILRRAIFAPNVFTPAEEDNRIFYIQTQGVITGELFIYSRDGQLVYRTADYTEGWDGHNLKGRLCEQGNYIWKLNFRSVDYPDVWRTEVGNVLLLK